jgi:hypothetical protein
MNFRYKEPCKLTTVSQFMNIIFPTTKNQPPQTVDPGGGGVRVVCMRDIFILNEVWVQHKTYTFLRTLLGCHILLIT